MLTTCIKEKKKQSKRITSTMKTARSDYQSKAMNFQHQCTPVQMSIVCPRSLEYRKLQYEMGQGFLELQQIKRRCGYKVFES